VDCQYFGQEYRRRLRRLVGCYSQTVLLVAAAAGIVMVAAAVADADVWL